MKSPVVLLQSLLDDFKRLEPDVKGLDRDIITISARFEHEGYSFLSVALSTLCDSLDQGLTLCQFTCPLGFSRIRGGALPKLFSGLLCEVFDSKTGSLKETPRIGAIKCLREVLRLFKKVRLDNLRDEELHRKACRTFWDTDDELSGTVVPDSFRHLLSRVGSYVLTGLETFEPSEIAPRHGPGAVFEGLTANQKWSSVASTLNKCEGRRSSDYGFDTFLASHRCDIRYESSDNGLGLPPMFTESTLFVSGDPSEDMSFGRRARLISVPKSSTSKRTITVESVFNMFVQQGLNTRLRDEIARCRILKQCLALTDQSENQKLALEGSRTGEWSTLDLSSASDRLSNEVVKMVFSKKASFFRSMQECRTPEVSEKGSNQSHNLLKFAGMGNALTFPTQSVVFALIAITAILSDWGYYPNYGNVKRAAKLIRVFGDDIIVRTRYARQVAERLESFGLKVNQKKSFMVGNFRESCGLDAFRGYDVTPLYIKNKPCEPRMDASTIAGFVALSNSSWMRGLYSFANCLRETVENQLGRALPEVNSQSGGLGWHSRQDRCAIHRWNRILQRHEYRAPVVIPTRRKDALSGPGALLKFFLTPLIERNSRHLEESIVRFKTRIKYRWFPTETYSHLI